MIFIKYISISFIYIIMMVGPLEIFQQTYSLYILLISLRVIYHKSFSPILSLMSGNKGGLIIYGIDPLGGQLSISSIISLSSQHVQTFFQFSVYRKGGDLISLLSLHIYFTLIKFLTLSKKLYSLCFALGYLNVDLSNIIDGRLLTSSLA